MNQKYYDQQQYKHQIQKKYVPSYLDNSMVNTIPNIPVECKHIHLQIPLLDDFNEFEEIDLEKTSKLGLSESLSFGMDINMSLPEFNYVPGIEDTHFFPGDDILFGFKHQNKDEIDEVDMEMIDKIDEISVDQQLNEIKKSLNGKQSDDNFIVFNLVPKK